MPNKNAKHTDKEIVVCVLGPQLKCYHKTSKLVQTTRCKHTTCILFYSRDQTLVKAIRNTIKHEGIDYYSKSAI